MTAAEIREVTPAIETGPQRIAGRFRIHERIGSGRLGDIFSAIDEKYDSLGVGQHVAVQILPDIVVRNNTLFNRLKAGYEVLRSTAHPNIVPYRYIGRDAGFGYLVMELLEGASLRRLLGAVNTLPMEEVIPVIRGAGEGLRLLHAKDLVHGNLTADHVFVTDGLEVRLLDVVPLGTAEAIFRGAATSGISGRSTVGDDVFALACLAYEMLAGKHPFNHCTPAEAELAGREPDRIASLADGEWEALRRALTIDRAKRTPSVADFMRELGITGTERLQATDEAPPEHEHIVYPAAEESKPAYRPPPAIRGTAIARPLAAVDPDSPDDHHRYGRIRAHRRAGPRRAVLLGMLLAVLAAWTWYGQPDEQLVELIAFADESLDLRLTEPGGESFRELTAIPEPAVATVRVGTAEPPPATAPEAALAEPAAANAEVEPAAAPEDDPAGPPRPIDEAVALAPAPVGDDAAEAETIVAAAGASPEPLTAPPEPALEETIVSVSEGDGAARITPLDAGSGTPLVWWTSEHSARADDDFIAVPQQSLAGYSSTEVLHVPLVDDNLPESRESFFVNFGRHDAAQGRIERIATVRVDIVDDDY